MVFAQTEEEEWVFILIFSFFFNIFFLTFYLNILILLHNAKITLMRKDLIDPPLTTVSVRAN